MLKTILKILFLQIGLYSNGQEFIYELNNKTAKDIMADTSLSKQELKDNFIKYDFSTIWTVTQNSCVLGFIGENYNRIRIIFISITKDAHHPDTYHVLGKSKVNNNICLFRGKIQILAVRKNKIMLNGCESEEFKNVISEGVLIAKYDFFEDSTDRYSGLFKGDLISLWYLTNIGKIKYNNLHGCADGFCNNVFIGSWQSYSKKIVKTCNWGDYRIPFSGDLDIGAGEFSPSDKYLKFGWQTIRDAYFTTPPSERAIKEEEGTW